MECKQNALVLWDSVKETGSGGGSILQFSSDKHMASFALRKIDLLKEKGVTMIQFCAATVVLGIFVESHENSLSRW